MFGVTVKRSAFVGETTQQQQHAAAGAGPAKRTLQPMVTGTSVLGVKVSQRACRRERVMASPGSWIDPSSRLNLTPYLCNTHSTRAA